MEDSYSIMVEKYFNEFDYLLGTLYKISIAPTKLARLALVFYLSQLSPTDYKTRDRFYKRLKNFNRRLSKLNKTKNNNYNALHCTKERL